MSNAHAMGPTLHHLSLGALLLLVTAFPAPAGARCGDAPGDLAAVCTARAVAEMQCPCATAQTHGEHVRCVAQVANAEVAAGRLPRSCKRSVVRCAALSTCGRSGFVTCCRYYPVGVVRCKIKRSADRCVPPRGGT